MSDIEGISTNKTLTLIYGHAQGGRTSISAILRTPLVGSEAQKDP